jgi:hypothetical protein
VRIGIDRPGPSGPGLFSLAPPLHPCGQGCKLQELARRIAIGRASVGVQPGCAARAGQLVGFLASLRREAFLALPFPLCEVPLFEAFSAV